MCCVLTRTRPRSRLCAASPRPTTSTWQRSTASRADVDVVTYEFENVPAETATFLSARKPVLPDPKVLAITQDRLTEKEFVHGPWHRYRDIRGGRFTRRPHRRAEVRRPAGRAEDAALRLRRQRPTDDPQQRRSNCDVQRSWRAPLGVAGPQAFGDRPQRREGNRSTMRSRPRGSSPAAPRRSASGRWCSVSSRSNSAISWRVRRTSRSMPVRRLNPGALGEA